MLKFKVFAINLSHRLFRKKLLFDTELLVIRTGFQNVVLKLLDLNMGCRQI